MIHRRVSGWRYPPVEPDGQGGFTRAHADRLTAVVRATSLGDEDGAGVLTDDHRRLGAQQVVGVVAAPGGRRSAALERRRG